jgi:membrane-bound lytic murein transglycosylase D
VILAAGTPQILLPWDNAKVFQRNFEAHNAGAVRQLDGLDAPTTMTRGRAAARTGMSEADLRSDQQHSAAHADPTLPTTPS